MYVHVRIFPFSMWSKKSLSTPDPPPTWQYPAPDMQNASGSRDCSATILSLFDTFATRSSQPFHSFLFTLASKLHLHSPSPQPRRQHQQTPLSINKDKEARGTHTPPHRLTPWPPTNGLVNRV